MQSILRNLRKSYGFTLQYVANEIRVNAATLSRVERYQQIPSVKLAERLARFYQGKISEMQILYPTRYQFNESATEK